MRLAQKMIVAGDLLLDRVANFHLHHAIRPLRKSISASPWSDKLRLFLRLGPLFDSVGGVVASVGQVAALGSVQEQSFLPRKYTHGTILRISVKFFDCCESGFKSNFRMVIAA
jgi:hypothetical protein